MLLLKSEYVLVVLKLKASIYCAPCNPLLQVTRELLVDPPTVPPAYVENAQCQSRLKHRLDPTVLAHFETIERVTLKHPVRSQCFSYFVDHALRRKRLPTGNTAKKLFFVKVAFH